MAKHHLYDESPAIEHDEKGGTRVRKPTKEEVGPSSKEKGVKEESVHEQNGEGLPPHVRHSMDRHHLHAKHEHEHATADHHGHSDKKAMHERHEKEFKEMHTRHEKELGEHGGEEAGAGGAEGKRSGGGEPIEKVEKDKKG